MSRTRAAAALLAPVLLMAAPAPAAAQQMYECTWTIVITEITWTYPDGKVVKEWHYTRTEVCDPI